MIPRFLANENVPRGTVEHLRSLGHRVATVVEIGLQGRSDLEVVEAAASRRETILTLDLDFGRIFVEREPRVQILVLRPRDPRSASLNRLLGDFLKRVDLDGEEVRTCLVVVGERGYRVRARRPAG